MRRITSFRLAVLLLLARTALAAPETATLASTDLDNDGALEIVLQNGFIRLELDSGARPDGPTSIRCGPRFAWGGRVRQLTWRPTARDFLLPQGEVASADPNFGGMPEEFEQPILVLAGTNGTPDLLLKIGVGQCLATRTDTGAWKDPAVTVPGAWSVVTGSLAGAGCAVTFEQSVEAPGGRQAYRYRKRFTLEADAPIIRVERELLNSGTAPLATTWYQHPFFSPGDADPYDRGSWVSLPMRTGPGEQVDLARYTVPRPAPLGIWGALPGRTLDGRWFATGNEATGEMMLTEQSHPIAWVRVWTWTHAYAIEPFCVIDLQPGETWSCTVAHTLGVSSTLPTEIGKRIGPLYAETELVREAGGSRVLVLTAPQDDKGKPQDDIGYLSPCLRGAGCQVTEADVRTTAATHVDRASLDCVVVAGKVAPTGPVADAIRAFVRQGGGLVQAAPLAMAGSELAELLPCSTNGTTYAATLKPYAPNRDTGQIECHRLHLRLAEDGATHAIVRGLPLWPTVAQDIGLATFVEPKPEAGVVLRFVDGGPLARHGGKPALVVGTYGDGRVVASSFPVAWGMPPVWVNYARVGEYHRQLLVRCVLWASGRLR